MRIVASAIVVLAGAVCIAGSATFNSSLSKDAHGAGVFLLVVGGVCFVAEFIRTWNLKS